MKLNELLERYPWSEEWKRHHPKRLEHWKPELWKRTRPLENLWSFRVDLSVDDLWSQISDTSKTNRALGLPEMSFVEEDGVLFGRSNNAGWVMEWEDIPWEWLYGKELSNARIYSRGPASFVRARYLIEEADTASSSMLHIYFGWIPRNLTGRLFLKLGMLAMKSRYTALLSNLKKTEQGSAPSLPSPTAEFRFEDTVRSRIENIKKRLAGIVPSTLLNDLFHYFEESSEDELDRIRPYTVAERLHSPPDAIVRAMLHLTRQGALTLSWDVICPHCRGVRQSLPALGDIPEQASCDVCVIDFDATSYDALEITFHLHPSIRTVQKRFYCSAEPARKPHILLQTTVAPAEQKTMELNLSPARYRMRGIGLPKTITLQAEGADAAALDPIEAEVRVDIASLKEQTNGGLTVRVPGRLSLVNSSKRRQVFVIDRVDERDDILRPAALFRYQDFRDLFSEEALKPGLQLDIGTQYLLMTDLVGSTRLYDTQGDAAAFRSVKQHFEVGFAEVKKNGGAVVKTIGDALFAVLPSATALVTTALAIQKAFQNQPLKLRIALQSGPVLAVNLNTGIDYFGNTVNLLAKLEGALESGEIGMPASMYESPEIRRVLDDQTTAPTFRELRFSWKQEGLRIAAVRPLLSMNG
jgi:class 3 adenylate cyclase